ncbi:hypothetical protein RRG08_053320 [Elysia crispata]|uniref:Uncharacterized protein n=1 Tax=Elysia crispata TaxID=231223 RepID=A0AAE0ZKH2_9GAST|nr:hypothetical protein RRG08_053320 [Elysia crispata]
MENSELEKDIQSYAKAYLSPEFEDVLFVFSLEYIHRINTVSAQLTQEVDRLKYRHSWTVRSGRVCGSRPGPVRVGNGHGSTQHNTTHSIGSMDRLEWGNGHSSTQHNTQYWLNGPVRVGKWPQLNTTQHTVLAQWTASAFNSDLCRQARTSFKHLPPLIEGVGGMEGGDFTLSFPENISLPPLLYFAHYLLTLVSPFTNNSIEKTRGPPRLETTVVKTHRTITAPDYAARGVCDISLWYLITVTVTLESQG